VRGRRRGGTTLTEVVVASGLLLICIVPILKALTAAQATSRIIEWRTLSLALAQGKLDEVRARCVYHFDESFDERSVSLDGSYLCTVKDTLHTSLREVSVSVGYDRNANGKLNHDEIEVTLTTNVARLGPGA
jgi:hypothetical protein